MYQSISYRKLSSSITFNHVLLVEGSKIFVFLSFKRRQGKSNCKTTVRSARISCTILAKGVSVRPHVK